jgi:predicted nucleic acid-binding protein
VIVVDTSVVQYLHQLGLLQLLERLWTRVVVPEAVVAELAEGRRRGIDLPDVSTIAWMEVRRPATEWPADLGAGERQVMALALENEGAVAVRLGLPLTGTLGVLIAAKLDGLLSDLPGLLDHLQALGFRLDAATRAAALSAAGEG